MLFSQDVCNTCIFPQTLENLVQRDLPKCESQAESLKKDMNKATERQSKGCEDCDMRTNPDTLLV